MAGLAQDLVTIFSLDMVESGGDQIVLWTGAQGVRPQHIQDRSTQNWVRPTELYLMDQRMVSRPPQAPLGRELKFGKTNLTE